MGPAAIASRWRHSLPHLKALSNPNLLISFSRWLSEPLVTQAFDPENVLQPSVPTEPMFGLPKRGPMANVEGEDLICASSQVDPKKMDASEAVEPSSDVEKENYFSKAWASQKNLTNRLRVAEQLIRRRELLRSDVPSQAQDHMRVWQYASDMPQCTEDRFIIASYNILASTFARQQKQLLYKHVPQTFLDWRGRMLKIIFELGLCSPDIICLQEVDRFKDVQEELAFKGYVGLYKVRTGVGPDGCAIFWRKERFKLLQEESLEFNEMGMRDNVAQFCVFESLVPGPVNKGSTTKSRMEGPRKDHHLIVGNVHLLYNPKRGDIKLGQCRTFLEKAHLLSSLWPEAPIVIGGDFNSTPSSAIYDFLATSELEVSGLDRNYLSGQITKVANSASNNSQANAGRKSGPKPFALSQLKTSIWEAERSIEIPKSAGDSNIPGSGVDKSDGIHEDDARLSTGCSLVSRECMEDKASISEESPGADGFGKEYMRNQSKVKLRCLTKSSFSSRQTSNHENHQVKQLPGLAIESTLCNNHDKNKNIESTGFSVKGQFFASNEHSKDLEVSKLVEEGLHKDKLLSHAASEEQKNTDCSPIFGDNSQRCLNTSALNANEETSNTPELTSPSNCISHGSLQQNSSKSCDRLNLGQPKISERNNSSLAQALDKNPLEISKNAGNEIQWDLDELRTATGDPDCTVVRHKLNLRSVYSEVQGQVGTRDGKGEPLITTYNTMFRGTVDYIWRTDGLKPVRVLETVPLEGMLVHKGLPTKVWGSDHVAIACELAFTSDQTGRGSNKAEPGL